MNDANAPIVASYAHTIAGRVIGELHAVYTEINKKQQEWLAAAPELICHEQCGACCAEFEPQILECEALYLASWLLYTDFDRAYTLAEEESIQDNPDFPNGCPLQRKTGGTEKGSCTVYGGRALICRLFGYCGDTGRDGKIRFKVCKFHPLGIKHRELREYSETELRICFGSLPPSMAEFGSQVDRLMPERAGRTELLRHSLPRALRKLLLLQNLNQAS